MKFNLVLVSLCAVLMASACTRDTPATKDSPAAADTSAAEPAPDTNGRDGANTPPTPCEDVLGQGEMTSCWSNASHAEEERVDAALKKLDELFASKTSPEARQHLQDDQRRWHEFVAGHCGLYGELLEGGSAAPMTVAICRWQLAQDRMQHLALLTEELDR